MLFMSRFPFLINNSSFQPTRERFIVETFYKQKKTVVLQYVSFLCLPGPTNSPDLICIASSDFVGAEKNLQNFLPHKQKYGLLMRTEKLTKSECQSSGEARLFLPACQEVCLGEILS